MRPRRDKEHYTDKSEDRQAKEHHYNRPERRVQAPFLIGKISRIAFEGIEQTGQILR